MGNQEIETILLNFLQGGSLEDSSADPFSTLADEFIPYYERLPESDKANWCSVLTELYVKPRYPFEEFADGVSELVSAIAFRTDRRQLYPFRERIEKLVLDPECVSAWVRAKDDNNTEPATRVQTWHYALRLHAILFMLESRAAKVTAELLIREAESEHFRLALQNALSRCSRLIDPKQSV